MRMGSAKSIGRTIGILLVVVAMPIFGYRIVFLLIMPLGLCQLTLAVWLMAKGFEQGEQS